MGLKKREEILYSSSSLSHQHERRGRPKEKSSLSLFFCGKKEQRAGLEKEK